MCSSERACVCVERARSRAREIACLVSFPEFAVLAVCVAAWSDSVIAVPPTTDVRS